jgi:hypothetical protein
MMVETTKVFVIGSKKLQLQPKIQSPLVEIKGWIKGID